MYLLSCFAPTRKKITFNNLSVFNPFLADNRCRYRYRCRLTTDTDIFINTDADTVLADTDISVSVSVSANQYIGLSLLFINKWWIGRTARSGSRVVILKFTSRMFSWWVYRIDCGTLFSDLDVKQWFKISLFSNMSLKLNLLSTLVSTSASIAFVVSLEDLVSQVGFLYFE